MNDTTSRRSTTTVFNVIPLAWPYWTWGATPTALAAVAAVLVGAYVWNVVVLAGLLVLLDLTDRVGQRGLLVHALWATAAGVAADLAHTYYLTNLSSSTDLLLVSDPLGLVATSLVVPGGVIFFANLVLSLGALRISLPKSLVLALGMAVLTAPWLALSAYDTGQEIASRQTLTGLYGCIALVSLSPWLLYIARAWARNRGHSAGLVQLGVAVGLLVAMGFIAVRSYQPPVSAQDHPLPGRLAFVARGRVYVLDGPSGQKSTLAADPGDLVAWSPDASRILVQRKPIGESLRIYALGVRDGDFTKLADGKVLANAWSPDGRSLLFSTARTAPRDALVWRLRLGEEPVQVAEGNSPSWSADGRRIAISAKQGGRAQVWVLNPDGSDPIQLTTDGGENPAWSPDGEHIAYTFNSRVYVMGADGSGKWQLTTGEELFDQSPVLAWSPDGKRLAYGHFQPPQGPRQSVVYVVLIETGAKARYSGDYEPPLAWSPDGDWLALTRRGEVWGIHLADRQERRLSPGTSFAWGGARPPVTVRPAPIYAPTPTPTPLPPAVVESPDTLVVNPRNTTTLYAGTPRGVVKRTASGGWVASGQGILYPMRVRAIALEPGSPNTLYAGTDGERSQQGGTLYKSSNGGARWTATRLRDLDIYAVAVDPLNASIVYAGTLKGVYKSTDAGATWRAVASGLRTSAVQALAIDVTPPAGKTITASLALYAGTRQGDIYKSTDGAATWTLQESSDAPVTSIALSPLQPNVVFVATSEGLLRTTDGGARWVAMAGGIWKHKLDGVVIDPKNPKVVYVVGPRGVFKSPDGGDNWGPVGVGLEGSQPTALAIDPSDPAILYAGTDKGVFRSGNGGISWER